MAIRTTRTWKGSPISRKCGTCQMCCVAIPIQELGKLPDTPCEHLCDLGCRVYGSRPDVCQGFACEWLWGMGGPEHRPDRMGAMPTPALHGGQLALYLATGRTPESLSKASERFIRLWHRKKGTAVLLLHGDGYRTTTAIFPDGVRKVRATNWVNPLGGTPITEEKVNAERTAPDPSGTGRTTEEEDQ
jgi:hypothetical protein